MHTYTCTYTHDVYAVPTYMCMFICCQGYSSTINSLVENVIQMLVDFHIFFPIQLVHPLHVIVKNSATFCI